MHGVYPGSGRGYVVRLKQVITLGPNFYVEFCPARNQYTYVQNSTSGTTSTVPVSANIFTYLYSANYLTVSMFRPLSACMKVYPNDSEMNRSGILYMGHTNDSLIVSGTNSIAPATVCGGLPYTSRVPDCSSEILWMPSETDGIGYGLGQSGSFSDGTVTGANCVSAGVTGGNTTTALGFTVEFIAVYEVNPGTGSGVQNSLQLPPSRNSLNEILRAVIGSTDLVKIGSQVGGHMLGYAGTVAGSFAGQALGKLAMMAL